MFASLAVTAILGLLSVCSAQDKGRYGDSHDSYNPRPSYGGDSYGPAYGYGGDGYGRQGYGHGYGYNYYDYYNALNSLDAIDERLDTLEGRELIHEADYQDLVASANENLNFRNKYESFFASKIEFSRNQQNKRLDNLAYQIERIAALRQQVSDLNAEAYNNLDTIQNQILEGQRDAISRIVQLTNQNLADDLRINAAQQQARDITHGIDNLFFKVLRNRVDIYTLYRALQATISAVNRQRSANVWRRLTPDNPDVSAVFDPAFDGPPQAAFRNIVGSKHDRRSHPYPTGYEAIYYGFNDKLWNNRNDISLVDMSSGGWEVPELDFNGDYIYFHDCPLDKSLLPAPRDD